ncbi:TonB-dependent receptor, beta-barrel domain protein, partial [mine drainage metagenome]
TRYVVPGFSASLALYREEFDNKFNYYTPQVGPDAGLTIEYNGGTAQYQGVEFAVRKSWQHWYLFANYSVNHASYGAFTSPLTQSAIPAASLTYVPHRMANLGVGYTTGPFDLDLYGKYTGPENTTNVSTGLTSNYEQSGYTLFNFSGQYRLDRAWRFRLDVYNLFNRSYDNYAEVNTTFNNVPFVQALVGEPRFYFVEAEYRFH